MTESATIQRNSNKLNVLHVDDEPQYLDVAKTYLESTSERFLIRTATSGEQALDCLKQLPFDCVISDHDMPGISGLELFGEIRSEYPRLPFILMSGKSGDAFIARAIENGISTYLNKTAGTSTFLLLANRIDMVIAQNRQAAAQAYFSKLVDVFRHTTNLESDDAVAQAVCETICANSEFEFAWIGTYDNEEPRSILVKSGATSNESKWKDLGRIPLAGDKAGLVLRRSIETSEIQLQQVREPRDDWRDRSPEDELPEWVASVPICSAGETTGVLCISARNASAFDATACAALSSIAEILSSSFGSRATANHPQQTGVSNV